MKTSAIFRDASVEQGASASNVVISSVRVYLQGGHAKLTIFNRGGLSGTLVVDTKDAERIVRRLMEADPVENPL